MSRDGGKEKRGGGRKISKTNNLLCHVGRMEGETAPANSDALNSLRLLLVFF